MSIKAPVAMVGLVFALNYSVSLVAQLPMARLSDRYRQMRFVELGSCVYIVGLLIYVISDNIPMIHLGSALRGLGFGTVHLSLLALAVIAGGRGPTMSETSAT